MKTDVGKTPPELIARPDEYIVEYQLESERGFLFMGTMFFSANMLLPHDPAHFTAATGEPLGGRLTDFEVPDDSWVWAWSRWYVDMAADVDDQGWCYAWRFGSSTWASRHRFMRSFVRQRVWKRPRIKRYLLTNERPVPGSPSMAPGHEQHKPSLVVGWAPSNQDTIPNDEDVIPDGEGDKTLGEITEGEFIHQQELRDAESRKILQYFSSFRNDREKVDAIVEYINDHPEQGELLVSMRDHIMAQLRFSVSKRSLVAKLTESTDASCQYFILAPSNTWRDLVLRRGEPEQESEMAMENREESVV